MVGIRRHVVQVLDKASRGGENEVIYLLAVKIKIDNHHYTMSTCLLGVMKANGAVWLRKTPHMLPLRLDDRLGSNSIHYNERLIRPRIFGYAHCQVKDIGLHSSEFEG